MYAAPGDATCTTTSYTCTVRGLDPHTECSFTVVATNAVGGGVPAAPSGLIRPTQCGAELAGPLTDVSGTHPFCEDVGWLVAQSIASGFADVSATHPFTHEIEWLTAAGNPGGYPDGRFPPAGRCRDRRLPPSSAGGPP